MALLPIRRRKRRTQYGALLGSAVAGGLAGYAEAKQRKRSGEAAAAEEAYKRAVTEREFSAGQEKLSRSEAESEKDRQLKIQAAETERSFKAGESEKTRTEQEKLLGLKGTQAEQERTFRAGESAKTRSAAEKLTRIREASQSGSERKPFEFEARTTRIRSSLIGSGGDPVEFDQTPLRFAMMSIAKSLANEGIDPKSADFTKSLLEKIKEEFPEEDRMDHGMIAEYMLKNSDKLPWIEPDEAAKGWIGANLGEMGRKIARMFLTRKAEERFGIAPKPQTIEDLINERLK